MELNFLPELPKERPGLPEHIATEQAFYASAVNGGDIIGNARSAAGELILDGESPLVDQTRENYMEEQDGLNRVAVARIMTDPSVPSDVRKRVVTDFLDNKYMSSDLRDKYREHLAALEDDSPEYRQTAEMQEIVINTLNERDSIAKDYQAAINSYVAAFNTDAHEVILGLSRDVAPWTAPIVNVQSAVLAGETGVDDLVDLARNALFVGSTSKEINEKFKALPLEQKKEFLTKIFTVLNSMPGTDYNKFEKLRDMILDENMADWEVVLENIGGALNLIGFGGAFRFIRRASKEGFAPTGAQTKPVTSPEEVFFAPTGAQTKPVTSPEEVLTGEFIPRREALGDSPIAIEHKAREVNEKPERHAPVFDETVDAEIIMDIVRPRVNPAGPAGTSATANPAQAAKMGDKILEEAATGTSDTSRVAGTNASEILSDWVLPKMSDLEMFFPSIHKTLETLDRRFSEMFHDTRFNPGVVDMSKSNFEIEGILNIFRSSKTGTYQQANSIVNKGLFESSGTAVFGRDRSYGFATREEAETILKNIVVPENSTASVFSKQNQWYIGVDWTAKHDPMADLTFGSHNVSSTFLGVDVSGLARSVFGKHIFPSNMRLDPWFTKGAFTSSLQTARVEKEFVDVIKSEIAPLRNNKQFNDLLNTTQENGRYFTPSEIVKRYPELSSKQTEELVRGYSFFRRLSEYEYNFANRYDRKMKEANGHKALYVNDRLVGYGTEKFNPGDLDSVRYVWDFNKDAPVIKPSQGKFVLLEDPIRKDRAMFNYAVVDDSIKVGPLPARTLNKIDGYIPRRNKERYYIKSTYDSMDINGVHVTDANTLNNWSRIIGAASTEEEAKLLVEKFRKQYPDQAIDYKKDRGDVVDSMLVDHRLYKESLNMSMTRGERLPTLNGFARLEDPLVALMSSIKSTTRLGMWSDYDALFRKKFVEGFNKFLPAHEYPNIITDIKLPKNPTPTDIKEHTAALRLFEYRRSLDFTRSTSDEVWANILHPVGDIFEKMNLKGTAEMTREIANMGMVPVRGLKSLGSVLFLHLNPPRQWLVQTQQLLEFTAMRPEFVQDTARNIPAIMMGLSSMSSMAKPYQKALMEAGVRASGMSRKEYEQVLNAIVKSGLPESVDLNMMLHGLFDDVTRALNESAGRQVLEGVKNVVKMPGVIGKSVGYGPAELANQIGGFLFARRRWMDNNPGKDWNTPENIAQIVTDGWDITHAMSTRSAAMPYQDGVAGLFFQFVAVQHKAFMQVFSSKTLSANEKARLAAARAVLFGVKGVPVAAGLTALVNGIDDPEVQKMYAEIEGGLIDWVVNNTINIFNGTEDSDLAISHALSPLPDTIPYLDLIIETKKWLDGASPNPRYPFVAAAGSFFEAIGDIKSLYLANEFDTPEALQLVASEIAEAASGYNNFAKYMMLRNFQDKKDKLGTSYGLDVAESNMIAQLFGVITKEEVMLHSLRDIQKEREAFIREESRKIHESLSKLRDKIGSEDYLEYKRRQRNLMAFYDPELRQELEDAVDRQVKFDARTKKENIYRYIMEHYKDKNDAALRDMINMLHRSEKPSDKEFLRRLRREGVIE